MIGPWPPVQTNKQREKAEAEQTAKQQRLDEAMANAITKANKDCDEWILAEYVKELEVRLANAMTWVGSSTSNRSEPYAVCSSKLGRTLNLKPTRW